MAGGLVKALLDLQTIFEQKAAAQIEHQKLQWGSSAAGLLLTER